MTSSDVHHHMLGVVDLSSLHDGTTRVKHMNAIPSLPAVPIDGAGQPFPDTTHKGGNQLHLSSSPIVTRTVDIENPKRYGLEAIHAAVHLTELLSSEFGDAID